MTEPGLNAPMDQYSLEDPQDRIRLRAAWEQVVRRIAPDLPPAWLARFIRPLKPRALDDGVASFESPGRFVADWVREKYGNTMAAMLSDELGETVKIEFVSETRDKKAAAKSETVTLAAPEAEPSPAFVLDERYTFDSFVKGQSNRLALAGARAVAEEPGSKYNPLFIYGVSGVGKTHLLHAIAREIRQNHPAMPIQYVSAQQFVESFVQSLQANRTEQFRKAIKGLAVWLLDDVQFIVGKAKTQEEVFHMFNYLQVHGKQIVITSDQPPRELYGLDERLKSRFEAGLLADIQPPDTETRCAIVLKKAEREGILLEPAVAMYLAEVVPGNIRTLEGALTKIVAHASLDGAIVDLDLAHQVIERDYRNGSQKPGIEQIVAAVSRYYGIPYDEIVGPSRKAPIAHARHMAVYLMRKITGDSWKQIGRRFGNRDHTSVMHSFQRANEMIAADQELRDSIQRLTREIYPDA
ncbi:MAG: chromosomal replication initiator protein DnaA [Fimbriimonadaceae bacterium]|nr:chromosomal replication initiator protein DnaA [Fimbriimonadaceae bacterium]